MQSSPKLLILLAICFSALARAQSPADSDPVLKANDVIRMEVFEEPDLSTQTRILKSGEVVLPLIGTVKISGLTVGDANDEIRNLYAQKYLVDPKVSLTIDEYSSDYFSVIGEVNNPGQFPMPANGKFDLSAAVASAGGLNDEADLNGVTLTRADGGTSTYSASSIPNSKVAIRPGDRIVVAKSPYVGKSVTIVGQVRKAGPVPFPRDGRLDLVLAISQAGGLTELANAKKVSINRRGEVSTVNYKEMTDKGTSRYMLQPGDIVTVAERFL
ncbi:polysaccharide biosynthesis/export family protein [Luteolibacter marinus]|uniref:polysaccharide biosynthesis/export family protein n=1 Tax=Luteolibacter marinus TaxID=2776705 RepID=UPI0018672283|nr:polysaccharide biosynthesis/export family protein [Luteolibacter marinus]